jgi:hypothetical protein
MKLRAAFRLGCRQGCQVFYCAHLSEESEERKPHAADAEHE